MHRVNHVEPGQQKAKPDEAVGSRALPSAKRSSVSSSTTLVTAKPAKR